MIFVINVTVFLYCGLKVMKEDQVYIEWRRNATKCQVFWVYFTQFLTLINYKSQNLLWSRFKFCPKL